MKCPATLFVVCWFVLAGYLELRSTIGRTTRASRPATALLKATIPSGPVQPGDVVVVMVASERPLKAVVASVFERDFSFYPDKPARLWRGLIGIDLEVSPGTYRVVVGGTDPEGVSVTREETLTVRARKFPTRRLTVDDRFVNPPEDVLERIRRESATLHAIFAGQTSERLWRGAFVSPVNGPPSSSFGKRTIVNGQARSPHSGTDFDARAGTPVQAPNGGKVVLADDLYYSGKTAIIDHGLGLYSLLAHFSSLAVPEGAQVQRGELIGKVGATGRVTAPHLHWAVRLAGARVDPLSLMAALQRLNRSSPR